MCLTCGCGEPNERHGNPDNITLEDLRRAAQAARVTPEKAAENIQEAVAKLKDEDKIR